MFLWQGRKIDPANWISPPELRKALAIHREKNSKGWVVAAWPNEGPGALWGCCALTRHRIKQP